jgi:enediyne biosynthesis protein E7
MTSAHPTSRALLGMLPQVRRDRIGLMTALSREYGDAVRFRMGPRQLHFLNHPTYARHVLSDNSANYRKGIGLIQAKRVLGEGLLTSEGEQWAAQRRTVQPALNRERVQRSAGVVTTAARAMTERWCAQPGQRDVLADLTGLTIEILERAVLNADLGPPQPLAKAFDVVQDQAMFEMTTLGTVPHWLPLPRQIRYRAARRVIDEAVDRLIDQHMTRAPGEDLLSRMLAAHPHGKTDTSLRDQVVTILLAGHETTASTLSWVLHELSQNPMVARRVRAEADAVLGCRTACEHDPAALPYTTTVVEETLRLHPPVWLLPRRAIGPDRVGDQLVTADSDVLICPYTLHRDAAFWDEPDRFRPERFASGHRRTAYAYLPFGAGPRVCVGSYLGMLNAVLVTAVVTQRVELQPVSGHHVSAAAMLTLKPAGGLPLVVTAR